MCAGDLEEDIGDILAAGGESRAKYGRRIIWQRLSVNNGQDIE
jgi:hypothetical protein